MNRPKAFQSISKRSQAPQTVILLKVFSFCDIHFLLCLACSSFKIQFKYHPHNLAEKASWITPVNHLTPPVQCNFKILLFIAPLCYMFSWVCFMAVLWHPWRQSTHSINCCFIQSWIWYPVPGRCPIPPFRNSVNGAHEALQWYQAPCGVKGSTHPEQQLK